VLKYKKHTFGLAQGILALHWRIRGNQRGDNGICSYVHSQASNARSNSNTEGMWVAAAQVYAQTQASVHFAVSSLLRMAETLQPHTPCPRSMGRSEYFTSKVIQRKGCRHLDIGPVEQPQGLPSSKMEKILLFVADACSGHGHWIWLCTHSW
jgi:hypothetical protein